MLVSYAAAVFVSDPVLLSLQEARLRAASLLVEDLKAAQGGPESGQKPQELEDFTKAPKAEAALQNCSDLTVSLAFLLQDHAKLLYMSCNTSNKLDSSQRILPRHLI